MKFKVTVQGKDSADECVRDATIRALAARGISVNNVHDDVWDREFNKEYTRLARLVFTYVAYTQGGNDSVTLEFDSVACTVRACKVPKEKKS